jgi:hypothetical protein
MEFLKDISVNLLADALWAAGGALAYHAFFKKSIH